VVAEALASSLDKPLRGLSEGSAELTFIDPGLDDGGDKYGEAIPD